MTYTPTQSVDDVIKLSQLMEKTGVAITVIAVFLVIILIVTIFLVVSSAKSKNMLNKQYADLLKETLDQNDKFTNMLMESNGDQSSLFKTSVKSGAIIDEHLKYLFSRTKADRVAVYVFHNGQRMLNGAHLLKSSCINEYALLDKFFLSPLHKETPISQIAPVCTALIENGHYFCDDTSTIEDPALKNWVTRWGYKSVYVNAIFNTSGEVIGFVSVNYIENTIYSDRIKIVEEEIQRLADKVTVTIDSNISI